MFGKFSVRDQLTAWVDKAIDVQDSVLRAALADADGGTTGAPHAVDETVASLETQYLATMSGAGAAVGGAASIPGIGTSLAVGLSVAETVTFLDATALFALACAEVKGCGVGDLPRRRALLLLALLGDDAVRLVPAATDGSVDGWGERLRALDTAAVEEVNRTAEKWLVTRFGPRQGMFIVGRLAPFGIGAAVGAAGNALTAKGVIARVRSAFVGVSPAAASATDDASDVRDVVEPLPAEPASPAETVVDAAAPDANGAAAPATDVGAPTGKYARLHAFLRTMTDDDVVLPIATLDAEVTGGLPAAARNNAAWWGNDAAAPRSPQTRAWLSAGLHVSEVELPQDQVRFTRGPAPDQN
jgi:hypothetical protein